MCKQLGLLLGWMLLLLPHIAHGRSARDSYFRARSLFKKKQWKQAKSEFQTTLTLIKKLPSRTSKQRLFVTLGECDVEYHLARIAQEQQNNANACVTLDKLVKRIAYVKQTWPRWRRQRINLLLPGRFRDAKKRFKGCKDVPTRIQLDQLPPKAKVFLFVPNANDPSKGTWKPIKPGFQTKDKQVKIKVEAPGYLPQTRTLQVGRWAPKTFQASLKKKPKPRVVKRRVAIVIPRERIVRPPPRERKPPPPAVYQQWWFWTTVGVVVAAGVAIPVGIALSNQEKLTPKCETKCIPFP